MPGNQNAIGSFNPPSSALTTPQDPSVTPLDQEVVLTPIFSGTPSVRAAFRTVLRNRSVLLSEVAIWAPGTVRRRLQGGKAAPGHSLKTMVKDSFASLGLPDLGVDRPRPVLSCQEVVDMMDPKKGH